MFSKYNWKQPIYKNDCVNVIINGLIAAILGGILGGLLDYLLSMINFPLSFSLILISYFVGSRVRKGYFTFHILYPTLAVVFLFVGLLFQSLTEYMLIFGGNIIMILSSISFYLSVLEPILHFVRFFNSFSFIYLVYALLELIIYYLCIKYTFRLASGNRN